MMFIKRIFSIGEPEPELLLYSRLIVNLKHGNDILLTAPIEKNNDKLSPYLEFYKWYFSRKSNAFRLLYKNGEYIVNRDNITGASVSTFYDKQVGL